MTNRVTEDLRAQGAVLSRLLGTQAPDLLVARELLERHQAVRLVGIGSSRHVALYGAACLELLSGIRAGVAASPGMTVPQPRPRSDELLLVVSQSGQTPALLDLAASVRAAGGSVLAVTNVPRSPLEMLADLTLHASAGPETVVPATKSVTASMLLLRALAAAVDPGAVAQLVTVVTACADDPAYSAAAHRAGLPSTVVCGGFAGQAVADEVALKLAEVVGHLAVPESVVDFLHGPAAVPGSALAFLDPSDPNAAAIAARPDTIAVGPSPDYALTLASSGDHSLDAIAQVVAGQCLAVQWALAHQVDPDDPRGLQKVTHTR